MPRIVEVQRLDLPELLPYVDLTGRPRPTLGQAEEIIIAESVPAIYAALRAGCRPISILAEKRHIEGKAAQLIRDAGEITVYTAPDALLETLTGYRLTRGVLCALHRPEPVGLIDLLRKGRRLALLEGVMDATNIGAIFRSAAALGMDGILLSRDSNDPLSRRSIRVSMGGVFRIPFAAVEMRDALALLKEEGFLTAAAVLSDAAMPLEWFNVCENEKVCVLLGTEASGLAADTVEACDARVTIPMAAGMDSLNVSAAAAILFWKLGTSSQSRQVPYPRDLP